MLSFDRETLTLVAVIVAIAASLYLYKEFTKTKSDIEGIKNFCNTIVQAHTPPPPHRRQVIADEDDEEEEEEEVPVKKVADSEEN